MKYYDPNEVNVTTEMIWNVTRFFTIDPDCWFDSGPTFTPSDSDDDNDDYDSVNVSYSLKTIMPDDPVSVRVLLHPKFTFKHPAYPLLYRKRMREDYSVTPTISNGYINVSLPDHYPACDYKVKVYLCNSTGKIL